MKGAVIFVAFIVCGLMEMSNAQWKNYKDTTNVNNKRPDFSYKPQIPIPTRKPTGSVKYGAEEHKGGAQAFIRGRQEVFNNGRTRGEVYGDAYKNFGGKLNGQRGYTVGGKVEHTWGRG